MVTFFKIIFLKAANFYPLLSNSSHIFILLIANLWLTVADTALMLLKRYLYFHALTVCMFDHWQNVWTPNTFGDLNQILLNTALHQESFYERRYKILQVSGCNVSLNVNVFGRGQAIGNKWGREVFFMRFQSSFTSRGHSKMSQINTNRKTPIHQHQFTIKSWS